MRLCPNIPYGTVSCMVRVISWGYIQTYHNFMVLFLFMVRVMSQGYIQTYPNLMVLFLFMVRVMSQGYIKTYHVVLFLCMVKMMSWGYIQPYHMVLFPCMGNLPWERITTCSNSVYVTHILQPIREQLTSHTSVGGCCEEPCQADHPVHKNHPSVFS